MDLQQALDLMRQVRAGPVFAQGRSRYYAHVATEDGQSFGVEVFYNEDFELWLESEEQAQRDGFVTEALPASASPQGS